VDESLMEKRIYSEVTDRAIVWLQLAS
jgi:hypothetical protein